MQKKHSFVYLLKELEELAHAMRRQFSMALLMIRILSREREGALGEAPRGAWALLHRLVSMNR